MIGVIETPGEGTVSCFLSPEDDDVGILLTEVPHRISPSFLYKLMYTLFTALFDSLSLNTINYIRLLNFVIYYM